jgi:hypothetical protein
LAGWNSFRDDATVAGEPAGWQSSAALTTANRQSPPRNRLVRYQPARHVGKRSRIGSVSKIDSIHFWRYDPQQPNRPYSRGQLAVQVTGRQAVHGQRINRSTDQPING